MFGEPPAETLGGDGDRDLATAPCSTRGHCGIAAQLQDQLGAEEAGASSKGRFPNPSQRSQTRPAVAASRTPTAAPSRCAHGWGRCCSASWAAPRGKKHNRGLEQSRSKSWRCLCTPRPRHCLAQALQPRVGAQGVAVPHSPCLPCLHHDAIPLLNAGCSSERCPSVP